MKLIKILALMLFVGGLGTRFLSAQGVLMDSELHRQVEEAIEQLKKSDSSLEKFFTEAFGYAVFPKVGKGGIGIGGAHGRGEVFEEGKLVGEASLSQFTIGLQLGGQTFIEIIFFENQEALENFKRGNFKLSAQLSAVAAAEGAAANAKYSLGVAIFTLARNGLMFEASVGGQKFKYIPIRPAEKNDEDKE